MDIEQFRALALSFPAATEDVKWGYDLCFSVGAKMFAVVSVDQESGGSFKVRDDEFDEMILRPGFIPAPYLARAKWVAFDDFSRLAEAEWAHYIRQSYELVKARLPKKLRESL